MLGGLSGLMGAEREGFDYARGCGLEFLPQSRLNRLYRFLPVPIENFHDKLAVVQTHGPAYVGQLVSNQFLPGTLETNKNPLAVPGRPPVDSKQYGEQRFQFRAPGLPQAARP